MCKIILSGLSYQIYNYWCLIKCTKVRILYIYICVCICKVILFCRKVSVNARKLKRLVIFSFLAIHVNHPRYFAGLLGCTRNSLGHSCFTSLSSSFFLLLGCTFISSLTFSKKEDSRSSPSLFPRVQLNQKILTSLFSLLS